MKQKSLNFLHCAAYRLSHEDTLPSKKSVEQMKRLSSCPIWIIRPLGRSKFELLFKKWAILGLFLIVYFQSFQTNIIIFTTIYVKKCPSSIRYQFSNPRSFGRESPPITTRPGLPPCLSYFYCNNYFVSSPCKLKWTNSYLKSKI